jgi:hypothetical protein
VLAEARAAGATIARPGAATFWGGYSGVFIDPTATPGKWRTTPPGPCTRTAEPPSTDELTAELRR